MQAQVLKQGDGPSPYVRSIEGEQLGPSAFRFSIETAKPAVVSLHGTLNIFLANAFGDDGEIAGLTEVRFEVPVIEGPEAPIWTLTWAKTRLGVDVVFINEASGSQRPIIYDANAERAKAIGEYVKAEAGGPHDLDPAFERAGQEFLAAQ